MANTTTMDRQPHKGSWDIHVHAAPSLFERWGTAWELAELCQREKMAGIILKYHHGSTVEIASIIQSQFPLLKIFGGITLNYFVGGLNPYAVETAIRLGGKVVWLPTIHAANHNVQIGSLGKFNFQHTDIQKIPEKGISIIDSQKEIVTPVKEILDLLDNKSIVLTTGHIGNKEIYSLINYIEKNNLHIRLLIAHVSFKAPALNIEQLKKFTKEWIWFEDSFISLSKIGQCSTADEIAAKIKAIPNAQWILSTDSGQKNNLKSPEAIDVFLQKLLAAGISEKRLFRMIREEPQQLLNL
jgi:hypothetical protein